MVNKELYTVMGNISKKVLETSYDMLNSVFNNFDENKDFSVREIKLILETCKQSHLDNVDSTIENIISENN
jgi:hypothetical protein